MRLSHAAIHGLCAWRGSAALARVSRAPHPRASITVAQPTRSLRCGAVAAMGSSSAAFVWAALRSFALPPCARRRADGGRRSAESASAWLRWLRWLRLHEKAHPHNATPLPLETVHQRRRAQRAATAAWSSDAWQSAQGKPAMHRAQRGA